MIAQERESVVENTALGRRSDEILRSRFRGSSIQEISKAADAILTDIYRKRQKTSTRHLLEAISESIPFRVPEEASQVVLQSSASIDSNLAAMGKKAVIFLYAGSILSAVKRFMTSDEDENDEICQVAIETVLKDIVKGLKGRGSELVYNSAEKGAAKYVAEREGVPLGWFSDDQAYFAIMSAISEIVGSRRLLSNEEVEDMAQELAGETGISPELLTEFLVFRDGLKYLDGRDFDKSREEKDGFTGAVERLRIQTIDEVFLSLSHRQRRVLQLRYGLEDGIHRSLQEVGIELGVSRERIRQIEAGALRKMMHPKRAKRLFEFLE